MAVTIQPDARQSFEIVEEDGGWRVVMNGVAHSWVDLDDPTRLEFAYMLRMADYLDACWPAGERMRVIHIGGAAMSLPRYIAARRPTSPQIVLEPFVELTQAVRELLPLPARSGIKVRAVDGRTGIAQMPDDYAQVVIVDAFDDATVPASLTSIEFYSEVRRILHPDGLVLANLIDAHPLIWSKRVVASASACFSHVSLSAESATLKGRRHGNLVLAASNVELPLDYVIRRAAGSAFPFRVLHDSVLRDFVAGARPFTDADAVSSPQVERGLFYFD